MEKLVPLEELFVKDSVSGTVQPSPFAENATMGKGFTVMYAVLISASTVPTELVTTKVMVNVPAVVKACEGLVVDAYDPSPKSQALETMAFGPLGTEVFVKFTGTPTQTTKGLAVKLAVGVCAFAQKAKTKQMNVR